MATNAGIARQHLRVPHSIPELRRWNLLPAPWQRRAARLRALCASMGGALALSLALGGCKDDAERSAALAVGHAELLVKAASKDVEEVRKGLPEGAKKLATLWPKTEHIADNPVALREALESARNAVQDLRVAKSTFFALATPGGVVLRNDREQDLMAGKLLFEGFPSLARAATGEYVEAVGSMPEAHGVKGKPDGEWFAAQGVRVGNELPALYVTGWAWSSYAYRLEFALRGEVRNELQDTRAKLPLLYVFVVVDRAVYSAPVAPEINAESIGKLEPMQHLREKDGFSSVLEIAGRRFGLGAKLAPELGPNVALAVLRSET